MTPEQIASCFCQSRLAARALDAYPGENLPASLDDAYHIQELGLQRWPDRLRGWKVARIAPSFRPADGEERLVGPIFMRSLWSVENQPVVAPVIERGYAAAEAEIALKIADRIPAEAQFGDPIQLLTYVEGAYAAVELAGSPLALLGTLGPAAVVSDFGNHLGLIVGAKLPTDVLIHPADVGTTMRINDQLVGSGTVGQAPGGPLEALLFLVEHLRRRRRTLNAGEWVATGATTGGHPVSPGDRVEARFGDMAAVSVEISAARAA